MKWRECPIAKAASSSIQSTAIVLEGNEISYSYLHDAVCRSVTFLKQLSITDDDRVAFVVDSSNVFESIVMFWSLFRIGAVAFPLSFRLPINQQKDMQRQANTRFISISSNYWASCQPAMEQDIVLEQLATIMLTSGSSGAPKLAVHSFANHYYASSQALYAHPLISGDRWLLQLPLCHVGGLAILFRCFFSGATVVIRNENLSFDAQMQSDQVSHVSMVATQLYRWLQKHPFNRPSTLQLLLLGGMPLPHLLAKRAINLGLPLAKTYGLTEMASQVAVSPIFEKDSDVRHSGSILNGIDIRLAPDGEILLRGASLFKGYVREGIYELPLDVDGFFQTGDRGTLNHSGELTLLGRKDRMFISGGENIQPEEIESALLSIEGIHQSRVCAVDDEEFGKRPIAYVDTDLDIETIRQHLASVLPSYKIPKIYDDISHFSSKQRSSKLDDGV